MLGEICACLDISGIIGKSNSPSIMDRIIYPLVNFELMIFFCHTLFRWAYTAMKFPVHPESATDKISSFVSCLFFVVGARAIFIHAYIFSNTLWNLPLKFNELCLWSSNPPLFHLLPHTNVLLLCDPPQFFTVCHFLFVTKTVPYACFRCMRVTCVISMEPAVFFIVVFIFIGIGLPLWSGFFLHVYGCPTPFPVPLNSVVRATAATLRLHIYDWSDQICFSCWLSCIVKLPVVFFSSVNTASHASAANAKLIKAYSISTCLMLLVLSYPAALVVFSSSYRSRYASWKCAFKCTHVRSFFAMLFHMRYACVYYCADNIWAMPMSASWRLYSGKFIEIANYWPVSIWSKTISMGSLTGCASCIIS